MATLVRWEPLRDLAAMQGEMSRFMNGLFEGPGRALQNWVPPLDVWETDAEVVYAFDLPGIPEDAISIEVQDETLTVSGEREKVDEQANGGFYRYERRYGSFTRSVGLPQGAEEAKIVASYKDGVLEVRVPKPAEAKPRKIELGSPEKKDIEQ